MHHIISDGVSMNIMIQEFANIYNGEKLKSLSLQYKDFAAWQNSVLESHVMKEVQAYWLKTFSDNIPVLNLPTDYERPNIQSFERRQCKF